MDIQTKYDVGERVITNAKILMRKKCPFCNGEGGRNVPVYANGKWEESWKYCGSCDGEGYFNYSCGEIEIISTVEKIMVSVADCEENEDGDEATYVNNGKSVQLEYKLSEDYDWIDYIGIKDESMIEKLTPEREKEVMGNILKMKEEYAKE